MNELRFELCFCVVKLPLWIQFVSKFKHDYYFKIKYLKKILQLFFKSNFKCSKIIKKMKILFDDVYSFLDLKFDVFYFDKANC